MTDTTQLGWRAAIAVAAVVVCVTAPRIGASETDDESKFDTVVPFEVDGETHRVAARFRREARIGFVEVRDGSGRPWTSPIRPIWRVEAADVDGDGNDEIVYGVWATKNRHGESGRPRAVWVMSWNGQRLVPEWRGSAMADPMSTFTASDVDGDGRDELVVREHTDRASLESVYEWVRFGFRRRDTSRRLGKTSCLLTDDDRNGENR